MTTIGEAIDRCESPIEQAFLVGLLILGDYTFKPCGPLPTIAKDSTGVELLQQVEVGGYSIDFGLTRAGATTRLAIELDGFVHHGSTPEQFERDKARERALTGLGWTFLRFAGREVRRDPRRCAEEAMLAASRLLVGTTEAPKPASHPVSLPWAEQLEIARKADASARAKHGLPPRTLR